MNAEDTRQTCRCKYATPTLFLRWPLWIDSWSWPWSCIRDGGPRVLKTGEVCQTCGRWEPRPAGEPPT